MPCSSHCCSCISPSSDPYISAATNLATEELISCDPGSLLAPAQVSFAELCPAQVFFPQFFLPRDCLIRVCDTKAGHSGLRMPWIFKGFCPQNYVSLRIKEIARSADRAMPGDGLGEMQKSSWQFARRAFVVPLNPINSTGKTTPSAARNVQKGICHSNLVIGLRSPLATAQGKGCMWQRGEVVGAK